MSVWDDDFNEDLDKDDFEAWLDSVNESGDSEMDEHYYNEVQAQEWLDLDHFPHLLLFQSLILLY